MYKSDGTNGGPKTLVAHVWVDNATDTFNKQSGSGNMTLVMSGTTTGPLPSDATTLTGLANTSLKPLLIGIRSGGWS